MTKPDKSRGIKILVLIIMVALIATAVYRHILSSRQNSDVVSASGTIEAIEMDISPRVGGRIATLNVDEGDAVKKGQVIAVLDAAELSARVSQAEGAVSSAEARLADLVKGSREEQIRQASANYQIALAGARGAKDVYGTATESYYKSTELKSNLAMAQANYKASARLRDAAAAGLALVQKGPRREEIDRLKANVGQARAQLTSAEQDYQRFASLYKDGAISGQQFDTVVAKRDSLRASLEAADAMYNEGIAGARPEELDTAKARLAEANARFAGAKDVLSAAKEAYTDRLESLQRVQTTRSSNASANAQVDAAKAALDLTLAGATSDAIKAARGQVEQAHGALAEAKSLLSQATILAPEDGVVTVKSREIGEVVSPGTPLVRIADLSKVWLRVYAPLTTLGKIKIGQSASVSADTYKGKVYKGTVASIKEDPEFTPRNVQTVEERVKFVYAIRINIDNKSRELKPGMPADAEIDIAGGSAVKR